MDLLAWLRRNAPSLAELYEGAVYLIFENPLPGRIRFVGHAVREIRNRLPDAISGTKTTGWFDRTSRLDSVVNLWNKAGLVADGSIPPSDFAKSSTEVPHSDIEVPREVYLAIASLLKDHEISRERPLEAATRLFEGLAPENQQLRNTLRPVILQWLQVTNWFMDRTHDSGKVDADCKEKELRKHFELFEWTLAALVQGFFTTIEGLDEILEDANSRSG